jgi:hypothetical protein
VRDALDAKPKATDKQIVKTTGLELARVASARKTIDILASATEYAAAAASKKRKLAAKDKSSSKRLATNKANLERMTAKNKAYGTQTCAHCTSQYNTKSGMDKHVTRWHTH